MSIEAAAGWRHGFTDQSEDAFADGFADDVVLEASVLIKPIEGKERVIAALRAAADIYDSVTFTGQARARSTTYLQWQVTGLGGLTIDGVTVLDHNPAGKIIRAAVHHRPLPAVLKFSAEVGKRLAGLVDADHFYSDAP